MAKQHIVKSVFWLTVSEVIYNASGYVIHSGVGRMLGPEDYGRYGLIVTLTTMIIMLIGNGIPTAMSKFLSEVFETNPEMVHVIKRKAAWIQCSVIGAVTIIFFLCAPLLALALKDPGLTRLFRISTLIIPAFAAASFYFYYFTGIHKFNLQAILKTVRSISRVFFILILAWFFKVEGSILGYVVAPLFVFLIAFGIDKFFTTPQIDQQIKEGSEKNKNEEKEFHWKKLAGYAWPMTLFLLFYEFMISIDLYMTKNLLSNDYLTGIYNGALTVGRIPYFLFYAVTIVLLPTISKTTSQKNDAETKSVVGQSLRLMMILLFPMAILMIIFSDQIIHLFYGSKYATASEPMQILIVGMSFLTVFYVLSFAINGAGKVKIPMWISLLGMLMNITLSYIFIPKYFLIGAATATTCTSFLTMLLGLYYIKKEFGVHPKLKSLLNVAIASTSILALSMFFPKNILFVIWSLILFAVYLLVLYVLGEITKEDAKLFAKIARSKKAQEVAEAETAETEI